MHVSASSRPSDHADLMVSRRPLSAPGEQLLLQLGARDADELLSAIRPGRQWRSLRAADARQLLREQSRAPVDSLAVVGAPPENEVGAFLTSMIAARTRANTVIQIDTSTHRVRQCPRWRFLATHGPLAIAQLGGSLIAVGMHRAVAELPLAPTQPRGSLNCLTYLRPMVGTGSGVGGAVTHTHEVIRALTAQGVSVAPHTTDVAIARTAAAEPDPPCEWSVVEASRLFRALPASVGPGVDLALLRTALIDAQRSDAIYQRHARFSMAGAMIARAAGRPLLLEYNGSEEFFRRHWQPTPLRSHLRACEEASLRAAAIIFVVSEAERANLLARGVDGERIVVNPNGVDHSRFGFGGDSVRTRLGVGEDSKLIGFIGSFGPWHGASVLADAFGALAIRRPEARLLLVGDGPEKGVVLQKLRASGVLPQTVDVGRAPPTHVPAYLDACDVLVSPHVPMPDGDEFFGSPTKLFEYMAAGRAIVASRMAQIGEVLDDERSGLLVTPGDPSELTAALDRALSEADLRTRLGREARRDAIARHSWRRNATAVIDAFAERAD